MKKAIKKSNPNNKNIYLAFGLAAVALAVGISVFWWRLSHKMPPMPQGSVYGTAYLPVPLQQGVLAASPTIVEE
jgi:hypothetical protein